MNITRERVEVLKRECLWRLEDAEQSLRVVLYPGDIAERQGLVGVWTDLLAILKDYGEAKPLLEAVKAWEKHQAEDRDDDDLVNAAHDFLEAGKRAKEKP